MKEYVVKRYSFEELAPEAQEKAIKWAQDRLLEDEYLWMSENLREFAARELRGGELGDHSLPLQLDLYYSLSWSQGDGVCFAGRLEREYAPLLTWPEKAVSAYLKHVGHYYHEKSFTLELVDEEGEEITEGAELLLEQLRGVCRETERHGYKCLMAATTEAEAREYLINNCADELTEFGSYDPLYNCEKVNA